MGYEVNFDDEALQILKELEGDWDHLGELDRKRSVKRAITYLKESKK